MVESTCKNNVNRHWFKQNIDDDDTKTYLKSLLLKKGKSISKNIQSFHLFPIGSM